MAQTDWTIKWDEDGDRLYETGVSQCVVYPSKSEDTDIAYKDGVAWNGITSISESPSGAEASPIYADDIKYLNLVSAEEFGATIEAYTYPDEFAELDGTKSVVKGVTIGQQARRTFGLSYKTIVGNDEENNDYGYKLHLLYNCLAAPSEKAYSTINDSPEAISFSWTLSTTLSKFNTNTQYKPTALIVIDSTKLEPAGLAVLATLEDMLYGAGEDHATAGAYLPTVDQVATMFGAVAPTGESGAQG